jgi:murein tripeptide amidase MpaA
MIENLLGATGPSHRDRPVLAVVPVVEPDRGLTCAWTSATRRKGLDLIETPAIEDRLPHDVVRELRKSLDVPALLDEPSPPLT